MTSASETGLKTDDFSHKCSNFGLADNKFDFQTSEKYVLVLDNRFKVSQSKGPCFKQ